MADIKQVLGKPKKYEILGIEVELKPLEVKNLDLLMDLQDDATKSNSLKAILKIYLAQAFPEASEEEIGKVQFKFLVGLMEKAMEVNGLSE